MEQPELTHCIDLTYAYQEWLHSQLDIVQRQQCAATWRERLAVAWERRREEIARRRWGRRYVRRADGARKGKPNLSEQQVRAIRRRVDESRLGTGRLPRGLQAELAREFGVAVSTINDIIHGRSHAAIS